MRLMQLLTASLVLAMSDFTIFSVRINHVNVCYLKINRSGSCRYMLPHSGLCSKNVLLVYLYAMLLFWTKFQNRIFQLSLLTVLCLQNKYTSRNMLLMYGWNQPFYSRQIGAKQHHEIRSGEMLLMMSRNSLGDGATSHPSYHHVQSNLTHLAGSCHQVPLS